MLKEKKCVDCKEIKPAADFHKRSGRPCGIQARCKLCLNKYHKERRQTHPKVYAEYARREHIKKSYGLTTKQLDEMRAAQNGKCFVCGVHEDELYRALDIDHCHKSGKVRGLLCSDCNIALGKCRDNPTILRSLATYLESHL